MVMMDVLRSSVNEWECDQMGHLNVRHYSARANEGLSLLLAELGVGPARMRSDGLTVRAVDQHLRFHKEMRPGTAYVVRAGIVGVAADQLRTYQEIDMRPQGEIAATLQSEIALVDVATGTRRPLPSQLQTSSRPIQSEVPPHGAARGIHREPPRPPITRAHAIERGLAGAYLGPIRPEDCDEHGLLRESGVMSKFSDGMAHFFLSLRDRPRPKELGGAALEYRFVFRTWPRRGDFVEVRSGLKALGNKTLHACHFVFDVETGECVASAESVSVNFDLETRKSLAIPDDVRAMLQTHVIAGLGI